jgi:hypothetical protein
LKVFIISEKVLYKPLYLERQADSGVGNSTEGDHPSMCNALIIKTIITSVRQQLIANINWVVQALNADWPKAVV